MNSRFLKVEKLGTTPCVLRISTNAYINKLLKNICWGDSRLSTEKSSWGPAVERKEL